MIGPRELAEGIVGIPLREFNDAVSLTSVIIVAVGAGLTVSPLAGALGFVPLAPLYWLLLAIILVCYVVLTQLVKTWFYHRFGE